MELLQPDWPFSCSKGNRCGHDPASPRYFIPPVSHNKRSHPLEKAKENLKLFYKYPLLWLKELCHVEHFKRLKRTERREAVAALGQALLHYVDLATLKVGIGLNNQPFRYLTLAFLAEKAGLGLKRAQRALCDLAKAGYIIVERRFRAAFEKGLCLKGLPAIKTLTTKFFTHLGVDYPTLTRHRNWSRKQRELRPRQGRAGPVGQLIGQLAHAAQDHQKKRKAALKREEAARQSHIREQKAKAEQAFVLYQQGHTFEAIKALLYSGPPVTA